ncbi:MAG: hypothetical protein WD895_04525 [Acidimicrobiia bacterium]
MTAAKVADRHLLNSAARLTGIVALVAVMACTQTSGTARGVVISVEGSLEQVISFSVLVEGEEWLFLPVDDGDYEFALPHLREHRLSGQPILVGWELVDNVRFALSLADG